jgi:hypothetical protein
MFWNCSFQWVYRRVSGTADSKGVSEQANKTEGTNQSEEPIRKTDAWGTEGFAHRKSTIDGIAVSIQIILTGRMEVSGL